MTPRFAFAIVVAGLLGASTAQAKCGLFGTQLECGLAAGEVVIGTQVADEPRYAASSVRPQGFHGNARLLDGRRPAHRVQIELQDIGTDPSLCRRIGNEDYCY